MPKVIDNPTAVTVAAASLRSAAEPLGTVGLPMRDQVAHATMVSLLGTRWPEPCDKLIFQGSVLTIQRNALVQLMRGDWIIMVDDDMVWESDALLRLVDTYHSLVDQGLDPDIVGGLCFRRGFPYQPTLYMREKSGEGAYNMLETWAPGEVVEVDATGMAFALISKRCFERLVGDEMPPYEIRKQHDKTPDFFQWRAGVGEDLRFCMDVKAAGGRIFVDTGIKTGHVTQILANEQLYFETMARRDPATIEDRRVINDRYGMPTLGAREARERAR